MQLLSVVTSRRCKHPDLGTRRLSRGHLIRVQKHTDQGGTSQRVHPKGTESASSESCQVATLRAELENMKVEIRLKNLGFGNKGFIVY